MNDSKGTAQPHEEHRGYLLAREDTSEKVEYDQYAVFAEQRRLDDLSYSQDSIQGEV